MFYLVCYDVVSDHTRNKVAHVLQGYGLRIQKSVFECVLTEAQYQFIQKRLMKYLDATEDQVRFYPLSAHCRQKVDIVGLQPLRQVDDLAFIV